MGFHFNHSIIPPMAISGCGFFIRNLIKRFAAFMTLGIPANSNEKNR